MRKETAMPVPAEMMAVMREAALAAGQAALSLRANGLPTETKADRSPVTQADRTAEAIIVAALRAHWPQAVIVAEEACATGTLPRDIETGFFLVDPIDGTREFVAGRDEFTVNIAFVENGYPVAGVVVAPALGEAFEGSAGGAFRARNGEAREPISVRRRDANGGGALLALASRSHRTPATDRFLEALGAREVVAMGSSLKFCRLAEGVADVYPCFGPTMEWDTAAAQAVLEAAGGTVCDEAGERLAYGKGAAGAAPDFRNPFFVARGGAISRPS